MIKNIITYPTPINIAHASDVRVFDNELFTFIDDLKETAKSLNIDGLSAPQVGSHHNLIVVKKDNKFLELINPRILNKKGQIKTTETTSYFPNISANLTRYESISLVYEDRNGEQHSLKTDGDLSILIQRKTDYLYGANFLTKLKENEKEKFEAKINSNGETCPTSPRKFSRDYFINVSNYLMILMVLLLVSSFVTQFEKLWDYQLYLSFGIFGINIAYILYSYYENKKFSVCTNCYNMNIFGVVTITLIRLTIIMVVSYLFI